MLVSATALWFKKPDPYEVFKQLQQIMANINILVPEIYKVSLMFTFVKCEFHCKRLHHVSKNPDPGVT